MTKRGIFVCIFLIFSLSFAYAQFGTNWESLTEEKIKASDVTEHFGYSVDLTDTTLVVGSPNKDDFTGGAYIYVNDGINWTTEYILTPSDLNDNNLFGYDVAIDDDWIAVGAYQANPDPSFYFLYPADQSFKGSVYLFQRAANGWPTVETQKVQADTTERFGTFGYSVDIDSEYMVVGSPLNRFVGRVGFSYEIFGTKGGKVYIFERTNNVWNELMLLEPEPDESNKFGWSVAISGNWIAVGAPDEDAGTASIQKRAGAVYMYRFDGSNWVFHTRLTNPTPIIHDEYGAAVSISEDILVVGDPFDSSNGFTRAGSAFVYQYNSVQNNWELKQTLFASDPALGTEFGKSVAIKDNTLFASVPKKTNPDGSIGALYFFEYNSNQWNEVHKYVVSDGIHGNYYLGDGKAAMSDNYVAIGSHRDDTGSVYILNANCESGFIWNGVACQSKCEIDPGSCDFCGDGIVTGTEQCDNNTLNGIACIASYGESCHYCDALCQERSVQGDFCGDNIVNGLEQCDGSTPTQVSCYTGPVGTENVGQCVAGQQTRSCESCSWSYSACTDVTPTAENCGIGGPDESCNGETNYDSLDGIHGDVSCPVEVLTVSTNIAQVVEGGEIEVTCQSSTANVNSVIANIEGVPCMFDSWSGSAAKFICIAQNTPGSQTISCDVDTTKSYQSGSVQVQTIEVLSSVCTDHADSASCSAASCEWCTGSSCNGNLFSATAGTCVDPGNCQTYACELGQCGAQCDTNTLGGNTCQSQGFDGGNLLCGTTCVLSTANCYECGDGTINPGEACDNGDERNGNPCIPGPGNSCDYCTNSCTIETVHGPLDGECGSANGVLLDASTTDWGALTFCNVGSVTPIPAFPSQGSSSSWTCDGENGGSQSSLCTAQRAAITPTSSTQFGVAICSTNYWCGEADGICPEHYETTDGIQPSCVDHPDPDCLGVADATGSRIHEVTAVLSPVTDTNIVGVVQNDKTNNIVVNEFENATTYIAHIEVESTVDQATSTTTVHFEGISGIPQTVLFDLQPISTCGSTPCYTYNILTQTMTIHHPLSKRLISVQFLKEISYDVIYTLIVIVASVVVLTYVAARVVELNKEEYEIFNKLDKYINKQIKKGLPPEQIRKNLLTAGWSRKIVEKEIKKLRKR